MSHHDLDKRSTNMLEERAGHPALHRRNTSILEERVGHPALGRRSKSVFEDRAGHPDLGRRSILSMGDGVPSPLSASHYVSIITKEIMMMPFI